MKQYRPPSWSVQAREFADCLIAGYTRASEPEDYKVQIKYSLQNSYRNSLIIKRAAKRLHRKGVF